MGAEERPGTDSMLGSPVRHFLPMGRSGLLWAAYRTMAVPTQSDSHTQERRPRLALLGVPCSDRAGVRERQPMWAAHTRELCLELQLALCPRLDHTAPQQDGGAGIKRTKVSSGDHTPELLPQPEAEVLQPLAWPPKQPLQVMELRSGLRSRWLQGS